MNLPTNAAGDECVGFATSVPAPGFVEVYEAAWDASAGPRPSVACDTSGLDRADDDDDEWVVLNIDGLDTTEDPGLSITAIVGIVAGGVACIAAVSTALYCTYCPSRDDAAAVELEDEVVHAAIVRAVSARHERRKSARAERRRLPQLRNSVQVAVPDDGRGNGQVVVDLPPLLQSAEGSYGGGQDPEQRGEAAEHSDQNYGGRERRRASESAGYTNDDVAAGNTEGYAETDAARSTIHINNSRSSSRQLPAIGRGPTQTGRGALLNGLPPMPRRASMEAPF